MARRAQIRHGVLQQPDLFPRWRALFIASVKHHRAYAKDPKLAEEVRTFYAQEGIHTREHERDNDMQGTQGYPIDAMDGRVDKLLKLVSWLIFRRWQLGVTCALEHFTAMMADWLLADPRVMEGADKNMAALWRWHAAEENEHKAVAFDVFKAAGGWYWERAIIMIFATLIFWAKVLEHQLRLMHHDGTLWHGSEGRSDHGRRRQAEECHPQQARDPRNGRCHALRAPAGGIGPRPGSLRTLAMRMAAAFRTEDTFGRWGGEEFIAVLPNTGADGAAAVADRVRIAASCSPITIGREHTLHITVSVGCATTTDARDAGLLQRADAALYWAKRHGRDRVSSAPPYHEPLLPAG